MSDDSEHGRGAVVNWKSYKKSEQLNSLKESDFQEQIIDFEDGWPWNFITEDPEYPNAYPWKLVKVFLIKKSF